MLLHIYGITYTILYVVMCKIFLETFAKKRFDRIEYIMMLFLDEATGAMDGKTTVKYLQTYIKEKDYHPYV